MVEGVEGGRGQLALTLSAATDDPSVATPVRDPEHPALVEVIAADRLVEDEFRQIFERAMQIQPRYSFYETSDLVSRAFCHHFFRDAAIYHAQTRYVIQEKQFERLLADALRAGGRNVFEPESRTHPYDLLIVDTDERISAKSETQARMSTDYVALSKILECSDEQMPRTPEDAAVFAQTTLVERIGHCDRMLVLRSFREQDEQGRRVLRYDIVEVPKPLFAGLATADPAEITITGKTLTLPLHLPGDEQPALEIKFDGSVHKVAVRKIRVDLCVHHACFVIPYGDEIRGSA